MLWGALGFRASANHTTSRVCPHYTIGTTWAGAQKINVTCCLMRQGGTWWHAHKDLQLTDLTNTRALPDRAA